MKLSSLISPKHVIVDLSMMTKKQVLQELAFHASVGLGLESHEIFEGLLERERLGTTDVGHGVAIPHIKLQSLEQIFCLFLKLERPIDFDAVDGKPVDLIWPMLAPTTAGADHVKALQRVSRILRDEKTRNKIRAESDAMTIYELFVAHPSEQNRSRLIQKSQSV